MKKIILASLGSFFLAAQTAEAVLPESLMETVTYLTSDGRKDFHLSDLILFQDQSSEFLEDKTKQKTDEDLKNIKNAYRSYFLNRVKDFNLEYEAYRSIDEWTVEIRNERAMQIEDFSLKVGDLDVIGGAQNLNKYFNHDEFMQFFNERILELKKDHISHVEFFKNLSISADHYGRHDYVTSPYEVMDSVLQTMYGMSGRSIIEFLRDDNMYSTKQFFRKFEGYVKEYPQYDASSSHALKPPFYPKREYPEHVKQTFEKIRLGRLKKLEKIEMESNQLEEKDYQHLLKAKIRL